MFICFLLCHIVANPPLQNKITDTSAVDPNAKNEQNTNLNLSKPKECLDSADERGKPEYVYNLMVNLPPYTFNHTKMSEDNGFSYTDITKRLRQFTCAINTKTGYIQNLRIENIWDKNSTVYSYILAINSSYKKYKQIMKGIAISLLTMFYESNETANYEADIQVHIYKNNEKVIFQFQLIKSKKIEDALKIHETYYLSNIHYLKSEALGFNTKNQVNEKIPTAWGKYLDYYDQLIDKSLNSSNKSVSINYEIPGEFCYFLKFEVNERHNTLLEFYSHKCKTDEGVSVEKECPSYDIKKDEDKKIKKFRGNNIKKGFLKLFKKFKNFDIKNPGNSSAANILPAIQQGNLNLNECIGQSEGILELCNTINNFPVENIQSIKGNSEVSDSESSISVECIQFIDEYKTKKPEIIIEMNDINVDKVCGPNTNVHAVQTLVNFFEDMNTKENNSFYASKVIETVSNYVPHVNKESETLEGMPIVRTMVDKIEADLNNAEKISIENKSHPIIQPRDIKGNSSASDKILAINSHYEGLKDSKYERKSGQKPNKIYSSSLEIAFGKMCEQTKNAIQQKDENSTKIYVEKEEPRVIHITDNSTPELNTSDEAQRLDKERSTSAQYIISSKILSSKNMDLEISIVSDENPKKLIQDREGQNNSNSSICASKTINLIDFSSFSNDMKTEDESLSSKDTDLFEKNNNTSTNNEGIQLQNISSPKRKNVSFYIDLTDTGKVKTASNIFLDNLEIETVKNNTKSQNIRLDIKSKNCLVDIQENNIIHSRNSKDDINRHEANLLFLDNKVPSVLKTETNRCNRGNKKHLIADNNGKQIESSIEKITPQINYIKPDKLRKISKNTWHQSSRIQPYDFEKLKDIINDNKALKEKIHELREKIYLTVKESNDTHTTILRNLKRQCTIINSFDRLKMQRLIKPTYENQRLSKNKNLTVPNNTTDSLLHKNHASNIGTKKITDHKKINCDKNNICESCSKISHFINKHVHGTTYNTENRLLELHIETIKKILPKMIEFIDKTKNIEDEYYSKWRELFENLFMLYLWHEAQKIHQ